MNKKLAFLVFAFVLMAAAVLDGAFAASISDQYADLSAVESNIASRINGTSIYNYNLQLENIALNHSLSFYSFRSSGSAGANVTAAWIQGQFESFGELQTQMEPFNFTTWSLLAQPVLVINADVNLSSFQCEHYSWPTPDEGVNASLVTLPLPYDPAAWIAVDTESKVLLIGAEVQQDKYTYLAFIHKLEAQPPAAIIFAWSSDTPSVFSPCAGKDFWNFGTSEGFVNIPVGWVSYADGQLIRGKMAVENVSAFVSIRAMIGQGPHYNVIAKLPGTVNPEKMIIISAHYDSSMDAAFCDDGAGTSALVELARVFSEAAREGIYKPQYTLVFIAFAGEELGSVGSINYVKRHASELGNIVTVINLDSIGSQTLEISKTFPDDNGLDLRDIVTNAAKNLGVSFGLIDPGGSDQETFRNPVETDYIYTLLWRSPSGIRNLTRVKSSIIISSYPLFYSDVSDGTKPGWIDTEYDNSSSTATLGWVTVDTLQNQTRVAGLSVMRVLSTIFSPFLLEVYGSVAAVGIVVVVVAYFERSRVRTLYQSLAHAVRSYIGAKEVLYIIILTGVLLLASFALHTRVGEIEVINQGIPTIVEIQYFGTPFEMFGSPPYKPAQLPVYTESSPHFRHDYSTIPSVFESTELGGINVFWGGLLVNAVLFLLSAFVITYTVTKLKYMHDLSKS